MLSPSDISLLQYVGELENHEAARFAIDLVDRAVRVQDISDSSGQQGALFERLNHTSFRRLGFVTAGQDDLVPFMTVVHGASLPPGKWYPSACIMEIVEGRLAGLVMCFTNCVNDRLVRESNFALLKMICHVGVGSLRQAYSALTENTARHYSTTFTRCLLFLLRRMLYKTHIRPAVLHQQTDAQDPGTPREWDPQAFVSDADAAFTRLGDIPEKIAQPLLHLFQLIHNMGPAPFAWNYELPDTGMALEGFHAVLMGILNRELPLSYEQRFEPLFHFLMATAWSKEEGFLNPSHVNINGSHIKWMLRGAVWYANARKPFPPHTPPDDKAIELVGLLGYSDPPNIPPRTLPFRELASFCDLASSESKAMDVVPRVMLASATDPTRSLLLAGRDFNVHVDFDATKLGIKKAMRESALPRFVKLLKGE